MDESDAVAAFAAMAQETRLRIVRLLVEAGPGGLPAGTIGAVLGAASSRLTFHLHQLEHAGLVASRRDGRSVIYTADYASLGGLVGFLLRDCCRGHPEVCRPAAAALASYRDPAPVTAAAAGAARTGSRRQRTRLSGRSAR